MRVTIVGGGLQGVELCWLARKAGWGTLLVDERPAPPALRLADAFAQCDVTKLGGSDVLTRKVEHQILGTDIVIPALENAAALAALDGWCTRKGVLFAFDPFAYAVTSSKLRSRDLFLRCGTPIPQPAARADTKGFPIIAKPSEGSGSRGVRLLRDEAELRAYIPEGFDAEGWVLESYCPGPSFSLEICGTPGNYRTFQVTDLLMDEAFDCRGVVAPTGSSPSFVREMEASHCLILLKCCGCTADGFGSDYHTPEGYARTGNRCPFPEPDAHGCMAVHGRQPRGTSGGLLFPLCSGARSWRTTLRPV